MMANRPPQPTPNFLGSPTKPLKWRTPMHRLTRHLALAALLSLPPATPAAILAFTDNATAPAGTHQTLSLNLFDSALGTLNAVTLTLSAAYQSQIIAANFDTSPIAAEGLLAMDFAYSSGLQGLDAFLATRSSLLLEDSTGLQSVPGATDSFPLRAMADRQADILATGLNPAWFAQAGGGAFTKACPTTR